jgi:hypothetical protein
VLGLIEREISSIIYIEHDTYYSDEGAKSRNKYTFVSNEVKSKALNGVVLINYSNTPALQPLASRRSL